MRRTLVGGASFALMAALAVLAPTGASSAAPSAGGADRTAPATVTPSGKVAARSSAAKLVSGKPQVLKAGKHDSFKAGKVLTSMGLQYVPYERSYRGLPVVGGDFVVATDASGRVLATSVAQTRKTTLRSTSPQVAKAAARTTSAKRLGKAELGRTRLVVLQEKRSSLAWETWVTGTVAKGHHKGEASRLTVYVDARTGKVLSTKEHVLAGTGTGNWEGSGLPLPTTGSGSSYSMTNSNASTLKCQNASGNATFTGTDDVWGNGAATDRETGCVDAFYSAEKMRQMMSTWLGRNGMNGSGGWVPIRVGLNDVNAYYDGTQVQIGHKQGSNAWIGSMDVVAHEFGHGVDDKTPGGISGNGTQEFVGDTFGAATEYYANNPADAPDFLVGEEINLVGQGPIRNMYNPAAVGDPNCYSSSIPNAEVHAAAGPGNHWFYLLSQGSAGSGGSPASPTCNSSSVTGIGIQKAQQIMYNAMLLKTSSSSYLKYRTWTLTAAKNLFPGSCTEFNTVKAAWDAVSVPAQSADPTCSASGGVTVTNPGAKTGTVGTAITSFGLVGERRHRAVHLDRHRPPRRRLGLVLRHRLRHADHGRHLQRHGHRDRGQRRQRLGDVHLHHQRWGRRRDLLRPEARQPRLRDRYGEPVDGVLGRGRQLRAAGGARRLVEGVARRLRLDPHRLAQPVGRHPGRLRGDAHLLAARRLRRDHHHGAVRQAHREGGLDHAGDVLQPEQGLGVHPEVAQPVLVRGADGDDQLHRHRGQLAPDVVRHRRHGADGQLT